MDEILKQILSEIQELKTGQDNIVAHMDILEGRMGGLEGRMGNIEGRMDSLEGRMGGLETHIGSIETHIDSIETHIDSIETRLDSLKSGMEEIKQSQARMEFELTEKVRALYDARAVQQDVNERIISTLERVEAKVDVLQMETAGIRRVR